MREYGELKTKSHLSFRRHCCGVGLEWMFGWALSVLRGGELMEVRSELVFGETRIGPGGGSKRPGGLFRY